MKKEVLYEVKLALKGKLFDTVKVQVKDMDNIPKIHKVLSYRKIK